MNRHIDFHNYIPLSHQSTDKALITELVRKSIHICSAFTVIFAEHWYMPTVCAIIGITLLYCISELLRMRHFTIFCITAITRFAERERDKGHVVYGPITLAVGVLITLWIYPLHTAKIAVYALAFGDGLASLAGKAFGRKHFRCMQDKTIAGSLACFLVVMLTSFIISASIWKSFILAVLTTMIEILPLKDYDNLFIPLIVGYAAYIIRA